MYGTSSLLIAAVLLGSMVAALQRYDEREARLERHVPEAVLWLLYLTFVATGGVVGYAMGINGARTMVTTHLLVGLIVVLAFIIIDLDRPRRGLVRVDQRSMVALEAVMLNDAATR